MMQQNSAPLVFFVLKCVFWFYPQTAKKGRQRKGRAVGPTELPKAGTRIMMVAVLVYAEWNKKVWLVGMLPARALLSVAAGTYGMRHVGDDCPLQVADYQANHYHRISNILSG